MLMSKAQSRPILMLRVLEGEQPYYTSRVVGVAGSGGTNEVRFYGIGKKRVDGQVDRLWIAPDGVVCVGEDVNLFGVDYIHAMGPRVPAAT